MTHEVEGGKKIDLSIVFPLFLNVSLNSFFFLLSSSFSVCQTVVNFISELQEQMCRFQKEINSKIQEKKALQIPSDSSSTVACSAEATDGQTSNHGPSHDRTSGVMHKLEEAPDENTHSPEEGSSDAEQQSNCGGESVGTACEHDFWCYVQHGLSQFSVYKV